jgi:hypothetical protein
MLPMDEIPGSATVRPSLHVRSSLFVGLGKHELTRPEVGRHFSKQTYIQLYQEDDCVILVYIYSKISYAEKVGRS